MPSLSAYEGVSRGLSYGTVPVSCIDEGQWREECSNGIFLQWQTSTRAIVVHSILFYIVLRLFNTYNSISITILFTLLNPGLLLTFPGLSAKECTNVSENGSYCVDLTKASAACEQCQSYFLSKSTNALRILIHGLVFVSFLKLSGTV